MKNFSILFPPTCRYSLKPSNHLHGSTFHHHIRFVKSSTKVKIEYKKDEELDDGKYTKRRRIRNRRTWFCVRVWFGEIQSYPMVAAIGKPSTESIFRLIKRCYGCLFRYWCCWQGLVKWGGGGWKGGGESKELEN